MKHLSILALIPLAACGSEVDLCGDAVAPPTCARRSADPCGAPEAVPATCFAGNWQCPAGAFEFEAPAQRECRRPYADQAPRSAGPGIPIGDRCETLLGAMVGDLDFTPARTTEVVDACPATNTPTTPILDRSQLEDDVIVDMTDTFVVNGTTHVVYRLFRKSDEPLFGVEPMFGGIRTIDGDGMFRPTMEPFFTDDRFRTAQVQNEHVFLLACGGEPAALTYGCWASRVPIERLQDPGAYRYFDGSSWVNDSDVAIDVARTGPQASLRYHPRLVQWVLTSAVGFGSHVTMRTAPAPHGPWSESEDLVRCRLPADDPDAFCHLAFQRPDLHDPDAGPQIVVSYTIGTLAPDRETRLATRPDDYGIRFYREVFPFTKEQLSEPHTR